jgi:hypothetical protein
VDEDDRLVLGSSFGTAAVAYAEHRDVPVPVRALRSVAVDSSLIRSYAEGRSRGWRGGPSAQAEQSYLAIAKKSSDN